jgi:hypothetical protein
MTGTIGEYVNSDSNGKRKKTQKWTIDEEERIVKYYDLYPNNILGLIHDYLPGRSIQQIYNKVHTLKNSGNWNTILERMKVNNGGIKTVAKVAQIEIFKSHCDDCIHKYVCLYKLNTVDKNEIKGVKLGVVDCDFNEKR